MENNNNNKISNLIFHVNLILLYRLTNLHNHQHQKSQPPPPFVVPFKSEPSLEELIKQLNMNTLKFQQRTKATIHTLENQIGQNTTDLNQLQSQGSNKVQAYTIINPKNASVITLRSSKNAYTL